MFIKNFLIVFTLSLFLSTTIFAQVYQDNDRAFKQGSWELNLSGDMGSQSSTYKYEESGYSIENTTDLSYFQLHIIPGYYFVDGFSFEPELDFLFIEDTEPSFSILPSLSYTYKLPDKSKLALYVRAGYGLSNSYNYFGVLVRASNSLNVGIINLGAGIKFLATDNFCLRAEINYKRTSHTEEETYNYGLGEYSYKTTSTLSNTRLLLGVSVIL